MKEIEKHRKAMIGLYLGACIWVLVLVLVHLHCYQAAI